MSRSGGYKCYNIQCGSCIGKTLCGEPGEDALSCADRIVSHKTNADLLARAEAAEARAEKAEMYKRLAEYEELGLNPQEIKDILELFHFYCHICGEMPPDRLRELVEADREGRVAIRPCKIGDTVYEIRYSFEENKTRKYGRKKRDFSVSTCTWKMKASPENCYVTEKKCTKSDFTRMGKTVFLTREAAEAALKGENNA